jgi:hypothetical protein
MPIKFPALLIHSAKCAIFLIWLWVSARMIAYEIKAYAFCKDPRFKGLYGMHDRGGQRPGRSPTQQAIFPPIYPDPYPKLTGGYNVSVLFLPQNNIHLTKGARRSNLRR